MQADPHPGNLIRTPDGRLALLDFGLVTTVDDNIRYGMIEAISHLIHRCEHCDRASPIRSTKSAVADTVQASGSDPCQSATGTGKGWHQLSTSDWPGLRECHVLACHRQAQGRIACTWSGAAPPEHVTQRLKAGFSPPHEPVTKWLKVCTYALQGL